MQTEWSGTQLIAGWTRIVCDESAGQGRERREDGRVGDRVHRPTVAVRSRPVVSHHS